MNTLLRSALALAGLVLATWHISWLHKQNRYEMQVTDHGVVFILDHQQKVIHASFGLLNDDKPDIWHTSALPKEP